MLFMYPPTIEPNLASTSAPLIEDPVTPSVPEAISPEAISPEPTPEVAEDQTNSDDFYWNFEDDTSPAPGILKMMIMS